MIGFIKAMTDSPFQAIQSKQFSQDYFTIISDKNGKIKESSQNFGSIFKY